MTTGQRIKQRRKQLGISADILAEKLGVSRSTVFRYESGEIEKMPIDIIKPIAEVLQTSTGYLLGWDAPPEDTAGARPPGPKAEFADKLFAAYGDTPPNLSQNAMEDVADYLRFVAEKERRKNEK